MHLDSTETIRLGKSSNMDYIQIKVHKSNMKIEIPWFDPPKEKQTSHEPLYMQYCTN